MLDGLLAIAIARANTTHVEGRLVVPISREEFADVYPTLFHISLAQDMGQVMRHGLLSTSALLDRCEVNGEKTIQHRKLSAASLGAHQSQCSWELPDQRSGFHECCGSFEMSDRSLACAMVQISQPPSLLLADPRSACEALRSKASRCASENSVFFRDKVGF